MYAIVEIAGQQFKVEAGNEIFVQRLADAKGADVEFKKVLLVANDADVKVGAPAAILGDLENGSSQLLMVEPKDRTQVAVLDYLSLILCHRN